MQALFHTPRDRSIEPMPPSQRRAAMPNSPTKAQHFRYYSKNPKQQKPKRSWFWSIFISVVLLALSGVAGVLIYRERYPAKQRCPPEDDRFHDHCKEGRTHYVLSLDWDCLGARRAEAMRMALSIENDGKPLKGVGEVPSWLTDENAVALKSAPCMRGIATDKACRYCKPTPRPKKDEPEEPPAEEAAAAGGDGATAGGEEGV